MRKSGKERDLFDIGMSVPSLMPYVSQYATLTIKLSVSWIVLHIPNCTHDLMNDLEKVTKCNSLFRYE